MADANRDRFDARLKSIDSKTGPGKRVQQRVTEDGLVVEVVKADRKKLFPFKSIVMAAVIFVAMKAFILVQLGETEYLNRISSLSQGSAVEVAAAFLLDADPATQLIADLLDQTLF